MFFSLSKQIDDRFTNHVMMGDFTLSIDDGWHNISGKWFKGYRDTNDGNWIEISWDGSRIHVDHGRYRSFPLWWNQETGTLTNLLGDGAPVWADHRVTIDSTGKFSTTVVDVTGEFDDAVQINLDQAVDKVCEKLVNKSAYLKSLDTSISKKLFLTGGIDTLVLYSLMKYTEIDVDIVDYEYIKYNRFLDTNLQKIKQRHWAYKQIHHWSTPTMFLTGGCGDEFMFRGPTTISLWAAWNDINLDEKLNDAVGYHVGYFKKEKNLSVFKQDWQNREQIRDRLPTQKDLIKQIFDININDHQHWHLGNTLTWTPFLDLEFTKIALSMDQDSIMQQVIDAELNRRVIKKLYEPALRLLSDTKNDAGRQNLYLLSGL